MSIKEALGFVATVVSETIWHPSETSVVERRGDNVVVTERTGGRAPASSTTQRRMPRSPAR